MKFGIRKPSLKRSIKARTTEHGVQLRRLLYAIIKKTDELRNYLLST